MFDSKERVRHLPYFTELASLEDTDPSWRAVSAGLVFLRLVDAWIEEGAAVVAADGWGDALRGCGDRGDARWSAGARDTQERAGCSHALRKAATCDAIAPRLMAYASVAGSRRQVGARSRRVRDGDRARASGRRRARSSCTRFCGADTAFANSATSTDAADAFATAGELAHRTGDMIGTLQARIGEAKIVVARGNLPAADAILDETVSARGRAQPHRGSLDCDA